MPYESIDLAQKEWDGRRVGPKGVHPLLRVPSMESGVSVGSCRSRRQYWANFNETPCGQTGGCTGLNGGRESHSIQTPFGVSSTGIDMSAITKERFCQDSLEIFRIVFNSDPCLNM